MGLMDFFIRPEPISYGTAKGLNTLQINRIAADLRTARDKVNNQMAKRELLEKQREAAVKVKTEAEEQLGVFGLVQILLQKTSDYARQQVKVNSRRTAIPTSGRSNISPGCKIASTALSTAILKTSLSFCFATSL